jgi:hypothetical protein
MNEYNDQEVEEVVDEVQQPKVEDRAGLASWEEPHMSFREKLQKHSKEMLTRLWGPAGSVVFHIVAVGVILAFGMSQANVVMSPPIDVVIEAPKNQELDKKEEVKIEHDQEIQERDPTQEPFTGVSDQDTTEPLGGSGTQNEGIGLGTGDPTLTDKGFEISTTVMSRLKMHGLYANRTAGGRDGALGKWGGHGGAKGTATEAAVLRSLRWLKKNQNENGTWTGDKINAPSAMVGMALLAYLAHNETPSSPEFGVTVKKAIDWLVNNQDQTGSFAGKDEHDYTLPICTYALCEAYAMTQHPSLKDPAIKAVTTIVKGQHGSGGFNYNVEAASERNDSSYMAWCCQALKSAKAAGLTNDIPDLEKVIKKSALGFKQNAGSNGGFAYTGPGADGLSGAGALSMQLLGFPEANEVKNTLKFLEPATFSFADYKKQPYGGDSPIYYWYYVTQAKFQYSETTFRAWNKIFSHELLHTQLIEPKAIADTNNVMVDIGHWESPSQGEHTAGLVQDTCLCTLMLEVYYRFLPSYNRVEAVPEVLVEAKQDADINIKVK